MIDEYRQSLIGSIGSRTMMSVVVLGGSRTKMPVMLGVITNQEDARRAMGIRIRTKISDVLLRRSRMNVSGLGSRTYLNELVRVTRQDVHHIMERRSMASSLQCISLLW